MKYLLIGLNYFRSLCLNTANIKMTLLAETIDGANILLGHAINIISSLIFTMRVCSTGEVVEDNFGVTQCVKITSIPR